MFDFNIVGNSITWISTSISKTIEFIVTPANIFFVLIILGIIYIVFKTYEHDVKGKTDPFFTKTKPLISFSWFSSKKKNDTFNRFSDREI